MYVIHKTENFSDTLQLTSKNNEVLNIDFTLSLAPETIKEYRKTYLMLAEAQKKAKTENNEQILELIGKCIIDLFCVIFGKDNTEKILDFYNGDYVLMITDVFPYINGVISPQIQSSVRNRKANIKRRFKR